MTFSQVFIEIRKYLLLVIRQEKSKQNHDATVTP